MRIAFHAPMKPFDHPVPSGEGRMAGLFMTALAKAGFLVELASSFRAYDGEGDRARQRALAEQGRVEASRLIRGYEARLPAERPALWFTYHLYHKAPDHLGPAVCDALRIPYVVAEASHAPKQASGPWAEGFRTAEAAIARADRIYGINPVDRACVETIARRGVLRDLVPFVDTAPFRANAEAKREARRAVGLRYRFDPEAPLLFVAAMMRMDQKLASYRVLADALAPIADRRWSLLVAGDGPAEAEVRHLFAKFGDRVAFAGRLHDHDLAQAYAAADLYVWPSVKEAVGLAFIEAAAAGATVVAGRSGGIDAIVEQGRTGLVVPAGDAPAFAEALASLLGDPHRIAAMGEAAAARALRLNDIGAAARGFAADLPQLLQGRNAADA